MKDLTPNILKANGLTIAILDSLSYKSSLAVSLKRTLRHFEKTAFMHELQCMTDWLDEQEVLTQVAIDYRVKSMSLIEQKFDRYYPDKLAKNVFNDVLGFRALCMDYDEALHLTGEHFRVVDMSVGKANDDGYRGVHVYYQRDSKYYPIEIQFNTYYDRQLNDWLHDFLYKKNYPDAIGVAMRKHYEDGKIKSAADFEEVLQHVLCSR